MTIIGRILQLMAEHEMNAAQLTREAGLTVGLISQWKKGAQKPSSQNLQKIADYFHVSVDYLLTGRDGAAEPDEPADSQLRALNFALSGEVHELTPSEKKDVLHFIQFVKAQRASKGENGEKETEDGRS